MYAFTCSVLRGATVLILDDLSTDRDTTVHSVVHGIIQLEELWPDYGVERRRLHVAQHGQLVGDEGVVGDVDTHRLKASRST